MCVDGGVPLGSLLLPSPRGSKDLDEHSLQLDMKLRYHGELGMDPGALSGMLNLKLGLFRKGSHRSPLHKWKKKQEGIKYVVFRSQTSTHSLRFPSGLFLLECIFSVVFLKYTMQKY